MDYYPSIAANCQSSIESITLAVDVFAEPLGRGSQRICETLLRDGKIMSCGAGVDVALSQLFALTMLTRFEQERPALPALALAADGAGASAIATTIGLENIYARQIQALGHAGDILLCISSDPGHPCLQQAVLAAHQRNMIVIALTNDGNTELANALAADDIAISMPTQRPARLRELHTLALNSLCELIDKQLFGSHAGDAE